MSEERWLVYLGGVMSRELLPKRKLFSVGSREGAMREAGRILKRYSGVNWVTVGRTLLQSQTNYYRDIDGSVRKLEIPMDAKEQPKHWVGALFFDGCHEPSSFVVAEDRVGAKKRVGELFAAGALFERAAVFPVVGLMNGWMSGDYSDEWKRRADGGVDYRDAVEERRLRNIEELRERLKVLEAAAPGGPEVV